MKRLFLMIVPALICGMMFTSCSGDSIGTKAGKEMCECITKGDATPGEVPGLGNVFVALGCYIEILEKYKEYVDFGEDDNRYDDAKFKDQQHQKDFEAALTKYCPEYAHRYPPRLH